MTGEHYDISTINDIQKTYKPRTKKAINNAVNDAVKDINKKNVKHLYH